MAHPHCGCVPGMCVWGGHSLANASFFLAFLPMLCPVPGELALHSHVVGRGDGSIVVHSFPVGIILWSPNFTEGEYPKGVLV